MRQLPNNALEGTVIVGKHRNNLRMSLETVHYWIEKAAHPCDGGATRAAGDGPATPVRAPAEA